MPLYYINNCSHQPNPNVVCYLSTVDNIISNCQKSVLFLLILYILMLTYLFLYIMVNKGRIWTYIMLHRAIIMTTTYVDAQSI